MKANATRMTAEAVKQHSKREYNPRVWEETVDRYLKYDKVEFYLLDRDKHKSYDEFFVIYTLPSGLRLMGSLSYSSSLTSAGFYELNLLDHDMDALIEDVLAGKPVDMKDYLFETDRVLLQSRTDVTYKTTPEARDYMTEGSTRFGFIFTKQYIHTA
jgi:hypothetical protein